MLKLVMQVFCQPPYSTVKCASDHTPIPAIYFMQILKSKSGTYLL